MRGVLFMTTQDHIDMWLRGWSCTKIAESAGVSRDTICRAMKRKGFDIHNRPNPGVEETIQECVRLRYQGNCMRDIADIVGYSRRQIQRWMNPKTTAP